jgi:hypothetical protein
MDTKKLQKQIEETFLNVFGKTPLTKRLEDIE